MPVTMLIVEDDHGLRTSLERSFHRRGHDVLSAACLADARRWLRERRLDLVLLDIRLPDGSGLEFLSEVHTLDAEILVVTMTAYPEVKTAVAAMKQGAYDFVSKPFELEELHLTVERAMETRSLRRRVQRLEREQELQGQTAEILGTSEAIEKVRKQVRKVAEADTPVLILGATGTGKELVADALHRSSKRARGPLIKVNCSAVAGQLLESELFGHEKGAFTDAREARAGLFEMADGGTLFLDEISEMRPELQAKLLRIVEGQAFRRIGGQREIRTNVRVLAASNRDLPERIREGQFREDLYFRLNVFPIMIPPLRQRASDVVLLGQVFLDRSAAALRKSSLQLGHSAQEILRAYEWPGNVRELRNVMERAAILCDTGVVEVSHLPGELQTAGWVRKNVTAKGSGPLPSLEEVEHRYILHVLQAVDGNLSEAARILGIARNTLKAKYRPSSTR